MFLTIHIKNKEERIKFAQEVRKLLGKSQTYIPKSRKVWKSDIGVKATIDKETYKSVIALIDRKGYNYNTIKE
tara:strand:- start:881 stop:1099 length:219 start_codon:yes stop_codon:yes gene_type:complete